MEFLDPVSYEMAGIMLYAAVIIMTLWDSRNGNANNNLKDSRVRRPYSFGNQLHFRNDDK